jgi:hypothetical protein
VHNHPVVNAIIQTVQIMDIKEKLGFWNFLVGR